MLKKENAKSCNAKNPRALPCAQVGVGNVAVMYLTKDKIYRCLGWVSTLRAAV